MYSSSSSGKRDFRANLFIKLSAGFVALSDLALWMWKLQQEHMERPLRLGYLDLTITARTPGECFAYSLLAI
jgi:hypothetical protein